MISYNSGNVLKEISEPAGAVIQMKDFILGDPTISVLELWGAEYQESNALLVRAENRDVLQGICDREKVPVSFVGEITGKMQHKNKQTNITTTTTTTNVLHTSLHDHRNELLKNVNNRKVSCQAYKVV